MARDSLHLSTRKPMSEDIRKIGLGGMAAGGIGMFMPSDSTTSLGAAIIFVAGVGMWLVGLYRCERNAQDEQKENKS